MLLFVVLYWGSLVAMATRTCTRDQKNEDIEKKKTAMLLFVALYWGI